MIFKKLGFYTPNIMAEKKNNSEYIYSSVNVDRKEKGMFRDHRNDFVLSYKLLYV